MADVFVSYSRQDKAFVQRLEQALSARQREAWVDWEGILPTEEFMQAIHRAIEATDTFLFVLSPDSVTSPVCAKEIAHAVAQNKRMVPVVAREVDDRQVPEPLAKLNWIFLRDSDDFTAGVDTLVGAFDLDIDWVRAHTRLLTRAIEWEAHHRNASFALRGDDLRAAETWLSEAGHNRERQPTALQTEYVIASRKAAARRQRILLGAVTVAMVVTIGLAILAYFNSEQTKQTLANADFLRARELIEQQHVDEAMAFLARSVRIRPRDNVAADRLFTLLTERRWMLPAGPVRTLPGRIVSIRFTVKGGCLAVCIAGDAAQVFDLDSGQPLTGPLHHDGMPVGAAHLSGDGTLLATADGRTNPSLTEIWPSAPDVVGPDEPAAAGHGRIWEVATGKPIGSRLEHSKAVLDIRFDAAGERVATASEDGTARVWDAHTGQAITEPLQHDSAVYSVRFSPDGLRLAAVAEPFSIWDIATAQRVAVPPLKDVILADYSPDGQQIVAVINGKDDEGSQLQHVQLLSARTGQPTSDQSEQAPVISSFYFDPAQKRLLFSYAGEHRNKDNTSGVDELDQDTGKTVSQHPMDQATVFSAVVFRSDGAILTASSDRTVQLRRWAPGVDNTSAANPLVFPSPPLHIALAPGNERFAVVFGAAGNSIQLWLAPTPAQESELFTPPKVVSEEPLRDFDRTGTIADTSRDARRALKFDTEDSLVVVDTRSGARISGPFQKEGGYEGGGILAAKFDGTGKFIAIGEGADFRLGIGYARVWNADTGQPVTDPLVHTLAVTQVSFSDDGKRLLTMQSKLGSVLFTSRIWALPTGAPVSDRMPPEVDRWKISDYALFGVLDREHGRFTQYAPEPGIAETRDVAFPAGSKAPSWLPLLAELAGGRQLNADTGVVEPIADHWSQLQALRAQLESGEAQDPFLLLGRWFLADPRQRTLSPYSALTLRSYLEHCTATKDEACLEDAKRLAGSDPKLLEGR